jgi:hypothetical protein
VRDGLADHFWFELFLFALLFDRNLFDLVKMPGFRADSSYISPEMQEQRQHWRQKQWVVVAAPHWAPRFCSTGSFGFAEGGRLTRLSHMSISSTLICKKS